MTPSLMEIRVHGRHGPPAPAIRDFAIDKFAHLARYLGTIRAVEVELYQDGQPRDGRGHVASVKVATAGPVFRSRAMSDDYRTSIEITLQRLERRVKEFKRRRSGRPAHPRAKQAEPAPPGAAEGES